MRAFVIFLGIVISTPAFSLSEETLAEYGIEFNALHFDKEWAAVLVEREMECRRKYISDLEAIRSNTPEFWDSEAEITLLFQRHWLERYEDNQNHRDEWIGDLEERKSEKPEKWDADDETFLQYMKSLKVTNLIDVAVAVLQYEVENPSWDDDMDPEVNLTLQRESIQDLCNGTERGMERIMEKYRDD